MTSTIEPVPDWIDQQQLAQQLVEAARADGVELAGPGGLLFDQLAGQDLAGLRPMPEGVHRLVTSASGAPVGGI